MADRPNQFKMMVSDSELATMRALAEREGLSVSDYLRQLILREARSHFALVPEMVQPRPAMSLDEMAARISQPNRAERRATKKK